MEHVDASKDGQEKVVTKVLLIIFNYYFFFLTIGDDGTVHGHKCTAWSFMKKTKNKTKQTLRHPRRVVEITNVRSE